MNELKINLGNLFRPYFKFKLLRLSKNKAEDIAQEYIVAYKLQGHKMIKETREVFYQ